jgi:alpha-ketoglutarate-dependent taurine dioxygenase
MEEREDNANYRDSHNQLVKVEAIKAGTSLPVVIQPVLDGIDLAAWAESNREFIEAQLLKHGAILFRNFGVNLPTDFQQVAKSMCPDLLDYVAGASPRVKVSGKVYTSTEFSPEHPISLHSELNYTNKWPMKILFFCLEAPQQAGETPVADCRRILELMNPEITDKFVKKRVMYMRNYHSSTGPGLSWQHSFKTTDKSAVENSCRQAGADFEWLDGDRLRIRDVRSAVATHPKTGESVWFNQAELFHPSVLGDELYEALSAMMKSDELPTNAFYGDGSPIELSVLREIRRLYQQESVLFPWQKGDILLLDNMLACHGRMPFVGPRKILVAMGEPTEEMSPAKTNAQGEFQAVNGNGRTIELS